MHIPVKFELRGDSDIFDFIENNSFGELITTRQGKLVASHLPFLLDINERALLGHFARVNSHWQELESADDLLIIFQGPNAYISPNWYESDQLVPTWNYIVAQVKGRPGLLTENETLDLISRLSDKHESQFDTPWRLDMLNENKLESMLKAIVGFRVDIEQISAQAKLSQNRSEADRTGAIAGLQSRQNDQQASQVAEWMLKNQP